MMSQEQVILGEAMYGMYSQHSTPLSNDMLNPKSNAETIIWEDST